MLYLLQGIVLCLLLIAGLAASAPLQFLLEGFCRVVIYKQEKYHASFLPFVGTTITVPLITVFKLLSGWFPKWMLKAAVLILILDLLLVVPMLLHLGWQRLNGKS